MAQDDEDEAQVQSPGGPLPEVLYLPSGGTVWFRDIEELSGRDFKQLRASYNLAQLSKGEGRQVYEIAAAIFVTKWDIPGRPGLPLPGSAEGDDGKITDLLHWRDCRALDQALGKAVLYMRMGTTEGDPSPLHDAAG